MAALAGRPALGVALVNAATGCGQRTSGPELEENTASAPQGNSDDPVCDDSIACTIDSWNGFYCVFEPGPNEGATACPKGTRCNRGLGCVEAPACATTADCERYSIDDACRTDARCEPASSVCLFSALDKDGDGDPPLVCGGQDCDDSETWASGFSPEVCDGIDNDCDGQVDSSSSGGKRVDACAGLSDEEYCFAMGRLESTRCDDTCHDLLRDSTNCGECGHVCPERQFCYDGECSCPGTEKECDGECIDVFFDDDNCGECGNRCPAGLECTDGECECAATNERRCDGTCVNLETDSDNCGECGKTCDADEGLPGRCAAGVCTAAPDEVPLTLSSSGALNSTDFALRSQWYITDICNEADGCPTSLSDEYGPLEPTGGRLCLRGDAFETESSLAPLLYLQTEDLLSTEATPWHPDDNGVVGFAFDLEGIVGEAWLLGIGGEANTATKELVGSGHYRVTWDQLDSPWAADALIGLYLFPRTEAPDHLFEFCIANFALLVQ